MAVKYKVVQRVNPRKPTDPKKYYASAKSDGEVTLKQLSKRISSMNTVNTADTLAVIDSVEQVMLEELAEGRTVRLGDFGSFSMNVSSTGVDKEEDVTAFTIKGCRIQFRPGTALKNMIKTASYQKFSK
jgi:predicted histone-like DNA-binding protein